MERDRLIWLYLKEKTNIFYSELKILHFAPEYIFQKKLSSFPNLDYISADLYSHRALVKMDVTNIEYQDSTFDVVLCNHVLEHVVDDRKAINELFRVLKPEGWAIIQSPVDNTRNETFEDNTIKSPEDRERTFGRYDHVRIYGKDYKNRLKKAGFEVKVDRDFVKELEGKVEEYGLGGEKEIYLCKKRMLE